MKENILHKLCGQAHITLEEITTYMKHRRRPSVAAIVIDVILASNPSAGMLVLG